MSQSNTTIHPIYAIVSGERFLITEALEGLLRELAAETDALGPTRYDGARAGLAEVLDEVRTPSLLGDRRVVIVDDADAFITANRPALERYAGDPTQTGSLILLCKTLPANTKLHKAIKAGGLVVKIEAPKGRAVAPWLISRARDAHGKRLSSAAARRLQEHLGDSLGVLDAELGKLAAFVGSRGEITPDDVGSLTGQHREEKVFAVMDAIANGDTELALRNWEQVLATDRAAPARAIAGLAWKVRQLIDAHRECERGVPVPSVARKLYTDPATLQRVLERFTAEQFERQQKDLLEADLAIKTGASTIGAAIEKFIVRHTSTARETPKRQTGMATAC